MILEAEKGHAWKKSYLEKVIPGKGHAPIMTEHHILRILTLQNILQFFPKIFATIAFEY